MIICCVATCKNQGKLIFHSFPKDPYLCEKWISKTKCYQLNKHTAYKTFDKVCKHHFHESDFTYPGSRFLKRGVVPSLNLPKNENIVDEHNYCKENSIHLSASQMEVPTLMDLVQQNEVQIMLETNEYNGDEIIHEMDKQTEPPVNINSETSGKTSSSAQEPFTRHSEKIKKKKYNPLVRKMRYQSSKLAFVAKKLRTLGTPDDSTFFKYISSKLSAEQANFLKMQIRNANKKNRGNRYTFEDKCMAIAIYKQSPKGYRFLSTIFKLPSKQTLYRHAAQIRFETGINKNLMKYITDAVAELKEVDKIVTIAFDEMSVTTHVDYSNICDYIDGFEDLGHKRTSNFASHALVFMIRGIHRAFKQPVAHFATSDLTSKELAELIKLVLEAVLDTGLTVIATVSDANTTNAAAVNILRNLRGKHSAGQLLQYVIRDSIIVHVFDPPHLLKSTRNNLLTKDLHHYVARNKNMNRECYMNKWMRNNTTEKVASWKDVSDFYHYNEKGCVTLLRKITFEHIKPSHRRKMKVNHAAQIFSATYGNSMYFCSERNQLSRDFTGTADVLLFFNDLFDSVNGDGAVVKDSLIGSISQRSVHLTFWEYAIDMLQKMKYVCEDPSKSERSRVLSDWIKTIKGLREITLKLFQNNFEKVSLRRTTQDALENLFGTIRGYCHSGRTTTIQQFTNAYAIAIFNNITSSHSLKSNCEGDNDKPLLRNLYTLFSVWKDVENRKNFCTPNKIEASDSDDHVIEILETEILSLPENEAEIYMSGFICKKLLKDVNCQDCRKKIEQEEHSTEHNFMEELTKLTGAGAFLSYPTKQFTDIFKIIKFNLEHLMRDICYERNLKKKLISGMAFESLYIGCSEHEIEVTQKLISILIEFHIFVFTKRVNNILSGKLLKPNSNDEIELRAFEMQNKKTKPKDQNSTNQ